MKTDKRTYKDATTLNHDKRESAHGAVVPPIYQNSLFTFESWEDIDEAFNNKAEAYIYSRLMNPTARIAEDKLAALSGAEKAKLCASGIAAISSAILHCVNAGDHIITVKDIYGPSNNFISKYLKNKFNVSSSFVDGKNIEEFESAINDKTRLIYLESPASLKFELQDLQSIASLAKNHGLKTIIDNTWASPYFQKPLELGIDIEVHSVSKYICGHSDVVAGLILSDKTTMDAIIQSEYELLGAKIAPFEAWLILRSLRTLPARMMMHQKSGLDIAQFLEAHPAIRQVYYPGLESFPQYNLGLKQMNGFSGLLSFELDTDDIETIKNFVDSLQLFSLGVSWGGHDSLVYAPVISYLKELSPEHFKAMGIVPGLIRISVGLEDAEDLKQDLDEALSHIRN